MYGHRDPEVEQAAATEDRAAAITARQDAWCERREREVAELLQMQPLIACVTKCYSDEPTPPVGVEFVAWARNQADGDRILAEAIYSPFWRHSLSCLRMQRRFASDFANNECDAMPESTWEDV